MFAVGHVLFMVLPPLLAFGHWRWRGQGRDRAGVVELFLLSFIVIGVGCQGILVGLNQIFNPAEVADYVGWPESPFISELGYMNLIFGLLAVGCIWVRGSWWLATGLGYSAFLLLAAFGHIRDVIEEGNFSIGNVGPTLWADIVIPVAILALFYYQHHLSRAGALHAEQPPATAGLAAQVAKPG